MLLRLLILVCYLGFYNASAQSDNVLQLQKPGLAVSVTMDDVPHSHAIWLNFIITNDSDSVVRFPYRYHWDFPIGMIASLTRKNGKSIIRFGTKHILATELLTTEALKGDMVDLPPGKTLDGTVNVLDMVIVSDNYGDVTLAPGKYLVSLSFFGNKSNIVPIEITRR